MNIGNFVIYNQGENDASSPPPTPTLADLGDAPRYIALMANDIDLIALNLLGMVLIKSIIMVSQVTRLHCVYKLYADRYLTRSCSLRTTESVHIYWQISMSGEQGGL